MGIFPSSKAPLMLQFSTPLLHTDRRATKIPAFVAAKASSEAIGECWCRLGTSTELVQSLQQKMSRDPVPGELCAAAPGLASEDREQMQRREGETGCFCAMKSWKCSGGA